MPLHVKQGGAWNGASPIVKADGNWKQADSWVKGSGVWYQASQSGIDVVIDSATTLYDFNLKTWLQSNGLWTGGPVVIKSLTITARTTIAQTVPATRTPPSWGGKSGVPVQKIGYTLTKSINAGTVAAVDYSGTIYYTEYLHDVWIYDQDLSTHAFTTGKDWPAGSRINTCLIAGKIQGRGGDGAGGQGVTYYDTNTWYSTNTTKVTNTVTNDPTLNVCHGWPGFETTIPIGNLSVTGEVAGGGGGGAYPSPVYYRCAAGDAAQRAIAEQNVAAFNSKAVILNSDVPGLNGRLIGAYSGQMHNSSGYGGHAAHAAHGCGGGQGGSYGGLRRVFANSGTIAVWTLGTDGGNGTLTAAGSAGTSTVAYDSSDTKYGGTESRVFNGGIPGATKGQDALTKLTVYQTLKTGEVQSRFDNVEPTPINLDAGYAGTYTYLPTKTVYSKGGNSITGKNLITTITGNFFGPQI